MFDQKLIAGMLGFNRLIHILLSLALAFACAMVIWDAGDKILQAWHAESAAQAFFHAFGSMFVLWTLATLISAEINYLQTGTVSARVFVVVALIFVIRELIVRPLQTYASSSGKAPPFDPVQYGLLLAALLVIGIVYRLLSDTREHGQMNDNTQINMDA